MKKFLLILILVVAIVLGIPALVSFVCGQTLVSVPNTVHHQDGTVTTSTTTFIDGQTCNNFWWDFMHRLEKSAEDGKVEIHIVTANEDEVVAGYEKVGNVVTFSNWHAGAVVSYSDDYYNTFYNGQVIEFTGNLSRSLDISFLMGGDYIWHHCSKIRIVETGGLHLIPQSTATMQMGMICDSCPEPCTTICFHTPFWWWANRDKEIRNQRVYIPGFNYGNAVSVSGNKVILSALNNDTLVGEWVAFQLNLRRSQSQPHDPGRAECYGITFEDVTLSDGSKITVKTNLLEIERLLISASKPNAPTDDIQKIYAVILKFSNIHNCPL